MTPMKKIKLTNREKDLIFVLIIILMVLLFYKFVSMPQRQKMQSLNSKNVAYEEEMKNYKVMIDKEDNINKELYSLNRQKENMILKYFTHLDQAQIIYILNETLDGTELKVKDIYFGEPGIKDIDDLEVKTMNISIPFEGSYKALTKFFENIRTSPRKIIVEQLTIDVKDGNSLSGEINLLVYSLEGLIDERNDAITIGMDLTNRNDKPFEPFEDYADVEENKNYASQDNKIFQEAFEENHDIFEINNKNTAQDIMENVQKSNQENTKKITLEDFESKNIYYMSTNPEITGKVYRFNESKSGKYSMKMKYSFPYIEDTERAYIVLDDRNIVLKTPPSTIGIWVKSYSNSPNSINIRLVNLDREEQVVKLTEKVDWVGWKYIEAQPPQDISLYPLKLDRIFVETSPRKKIKGVLLFDNLEAKYNLQ